MKGFMWKIFVLVMVVGVTIIGCAEEPEETTTTDPDAKYTDTYGGTMLGANIISGTTVEFTVFAPNASSIHVAGEFNSWSGTANPMTKITGGVWKATIDIQDLANDQYKFVLDGGSTWYADPYSKANEYSSGNSLIVSTSYAWSDSSWTKPGRSELVIYEMHIKDFTSHAASSGVTAKGKYAGVEEKIAYLTNLGINVVQFMPPTEVSDGGYSWGYNPSLYFAPESYMASANTGVQVTEMKHLINALHNAGIAVIFDVVYNHVGPDDNYFWIFEQVYYFDYNNDGVVDSADATDWGAKFCTWRPMVKKLMYDNMKYLMDTYHVDGFRLDSTENMDSAGTLEVIDNLYSAGYTSQYYIFEEFNGDHNSAIQTYNSSKGKAVISSWGTGYKNNAWDAIKYGASSGSSLGKIVYYSKDDGWNYQSEAINYISSHDEGTLVGTNIQATEQEVRVGNALLLTSMGIPMIWMGEEFMRIHHGNHLPTNLGKNTDEANNVMDWSLATANTNLVKYIASLIKLRITHPSLRMTVQHPESTGNFSWNTADWESAIGYTYKGISGDNDFIVLANFETSAKLYSSVSFPQNGTTWYVMSDGTSATHTNGGLSSFTAPATSNISVPAQSAVIYMSSAVN